ncbi:MAG: hypothetical protein Q7J27_05175 [Syntrophales bacterium]|nr:hypothetical protein [Syntrophales bacterium]
MKGRSKQYSLSLNFEDISLPPIKDILILGTKCSQGKFGVAKCFQLLSPDNFELIEIDDDIVQGLIINKRILKRIPVDHIIDILRREVFPYISAGDTVKVDINIVTYINNIKVSSE